MGIPRLHHRAAGDVEYLPDHAAGDIRREEKGAIADVCRGTDIPERLRGKRFPRIQSAIILP